MAENLALYFQRATFDEMPARAVISSVALKEFG
jgi:hypothetical protein